MTILLYDYRELEERAARHLKVWKGWHLTLYIFAAIFGILNYVVMQKTMELGGDSCVIYPRHLEFHMVEVPNNISKIEITNNNTTNANGTDATKDNKVSSIDVPANITNSSLPVTPKIEKEDKTDDNKIAIVNQTIVIDNMTVLIGNNTHHVALNTERTLYVSDSDCQFVEYMPLVSTIFAIVWITLFTMCAGGGRVRSGLQQPWRILTPALLFSLIMMALTAHSFSLTNSGLQAYCASFHNYTNSTTCSAASPFLERSWNTTWGLGGRASTTRAASAGVFASWACAVALLLARCLAAPDFSVKTTGVYLTKDPQNKITPHLKRSPKSSPTKRDTVSVKSDPTATTELVTASLEPGQDSVPTSLTVTPVRNNRNSDRIQVFDTIYASDEV